MTDVAALKKIWYAHNQISESLHNFGIVSLRIPSKDEQVAAYWIAHSGDGAVSKVVGDRATRKILTARCIQSWSITPAMLLGNLAKGEDAHEIIAVSQEAAEMFFDIHPQAYEHLADALLKEINERAAKEQEAEKN